MDTDSNYIAISGDQQEDFVRSELRAEFEAKEKEWVAWDKWSGQVEQARAVQTHMRRQPDNCAMFEVAE